MFTWGECCVEMTCGTNNGVAKKVDTEGYPDGFCTGGLQRAPDSTPCTGNLCTQQECCVAATCANNPGSSSASTDRRLRGIEAFSGGDSDDGGYSFFQAGSTRTRQKLKKQKNLHQAMAEKGEQKGAQASATKRKTSSKQGGEKKGVKSGKQQKVSDPGDKPAKRLLQSAVGHFSYDQCPPGEHLKDALQNINCTTGTCSATLCCVPRTCSETDADGSSTHRIVGGDGYVCKDDTYIRVDSKNNKACGNLGCSDADCCEKRMCSNSARDTGKYVEHGFTCPDTQLPKPKSGGKYCGAGACLVVDCCTTKRCENYNNGPADATTGNYPTAEHGFVCDSTHLRDKNKHTSAVGVSVDTQDECCTKRECGNFFNKFSSVTTQALEASEGFECDSTEIRDTATNSVFLRRSVSGHDMLQRQTL
jgi:hypothetical protein